MRLISTLLLLGLLAGCRGYVGMPHDSPVPQVGGILSDGFYDGGIQDEDVDHRRRGSGD